MFLPNIPTPDEVLDKGFRRAKRPQPRFAHQRFTVRKNQNELKK